MTTTDIYRDTGLIHDDVIIRICSQNAIASREQATPDATKKIQQAIEKYGWDHAIPGQIYAPYAHDESTLEWLVAELAEFPDPVDKIDRIFAERQLRWAIYCTPELAAQFHEKLAATRLAKYASKYSSRVDDLGFNASLVGKSRDECWAMFEELVNEQHEFELPMTFELDKTEILARRLATLGGVDKDLMERWLDHRPDFDAFEPELEEVQAEAAVHLLSHDPLIDVDVTKLLYWIEADAGEISDSAFRALRVRRSPELVNHVIDEFPDYSNKLKLKMCHFLENAQFPELQEKVWNLYQGEEDFTVLGDLAEVLAAYGGEEFEKAALEVLKLDGVQNDENMRLTIYTNRTLAGRDFKEKKEWRKRLSQFFSSAFIKDELSHDMDPDLDKDMESMDLDGDWC